MLNFFSQFTKEQLQQQYEANLTILEAMLCKAIKTGKKVNGYTLEQLQTEVKKFTQLSK